jgi:hypothetical protein
VTLTGCLRARPSSSATTTEAQCFYSLDTTIGALLADEVSRAVLEQHIPNIHTHPMSETNENVLDKCYYVSLVLRLTPDYFAFIFYFTFVLLLILDNLFII